MKKILSVFLVAGLLLGWFTQSALAEDPPPPAELHLSTHELDFGEVEVGLGTEPQSFTISNSGGQPLYLGELEIGEIVTPPPVNSFDFDYNPCNHAILGPGQTCIVTIRFNPDYIGALEGWVTVRSSAGTGGVSLYGFGLIGSVKPDPDHFDFGNQNINLTSPPKVLTIQNEGNFDLTFFSFTPPAEFEIRNNQCAGQPLAMETTCTLEVVFAPTSIGPKSGDLVIRTDGLSDPDAIPLTGIGINPGVGLSVTRLKFGNTSVGATSLPQDLTITNTGTTQLTFTKFSYTTSDFEGGAVGTCGSALAPGASCTYPVVFSPKAARERTGKLSIQTNARTSPDLVDLSGNGIVWPTATTQAATFVGQTSATLNGVANPGGTTGNVYFEYGLTQSYGKTAEIFGGAIIGWDDVTVGANITGLQLNTTYHYRVKIVTHDPAGLAFGGDRTFTTSAGLIDFAPGVVFIRRANPSPTCALTVSFTLIFSEAVTGVDAADFNLTTTGLANPAITGVSGSGTTYTVTVRAGFNPGGGTLRLDVAAGATIADLLGSSLTTRPYTSGETYTISPACRVNYLALTRR